MGAGLLYCELMEFGRKGLESQGPGEWLLPSLLPVLGYRWAGGWWTVCPAPSIHLCFEYLQKCGLLL